MKRELELGDSRKVTMVGTAHVSEQSKKEVRETIEQLDPDLVGVELDESRLDSLKDGSGWRDLKVSEAIREGKGFLLFMNLMLSIYQKRLGIEHDIKPGEELLEAVQVAEENSIGYSLLDRDINETLSRAFNKLSFWEKMKLVSALFMAEEQMDVEELKEQRLLDSLVDELEQYLPSVKETLLDERNDYMAERLLEQQFEHAVVVVGAAHVDGMSEALKEKREYSVEPAGKGFPWLKTVKYGLPAFIIGMLGYSFYQIGFETGFQATRFWVLANASLSMLGAIAARSHLSTWAVSFVSAPFTSLNPGIGAGMVAGYFEAKFHQPSVEELESIAYIDSYRDLWGNQVGRILLTFVLVTLGSAIATFVSAGYIASLIIG